MRTVLVEVEANLNARPLTYEYDEVSDEVLTPSHLVYGRRIATLPDSTEVDASELGQDSSKNSSIVQFNYLSTILEHFWSMQVETGISHQSERVPQGWRVEGGCDG